MRAMPSGSTSSRTTSPVLVDGVVAAGYAVSRKKDVATLEIEPYHKLSRGEVREVEDEGERFVRFMEDDAGRYEVVVAKFVA